MPPVPVVETIGTVKPFATSVALAPLNGPERGTPPGPAVDSVNARGPIWQLMPRSPVPVDTEPESDTLRRGSCAETTVGVDVVDVPDAKTTVGIFAKPRKAVAGEKTRSAGATLPISLGAFAAVSKPSCSKPQKAAVTPDSVNGRPSGVWVTVTLLLSTPEN